MGRYFVMRLQKAKGLFLVGDGDIDAAEVFLLQVFQRAGDVAGQDIEQGVTGVNAQRLEGRIVHGGREGMTHWMAQQGEWNRSAFFH